jgi:4-alpha-glucanotransferase
MKIRFNVNYHTRWGQKMYITGSVPELGSWDVAFAKEMNCDSSANWQFELSLDESVDKIEYRYFLRADAEIVSEWDRRHCLILEKPLTTCFVHDCWLDKPEDSVFYTSAFTKAIFSHPAETFDKPYDVIFRILAPRVASHQVVKVAGNQSALGNWKLNDAPTLLSASQAEWHLPLCSSEITFPLEYKFVIVDKENPDTNYWEEGDNRVLDIPCGLADGEMVNVFAGYFRNSDFPWWKGVGSVIPVFSLRSENSFGVGDLGDLRLFIDWVKKTNQDIIQVLPMNDTQMTKTWQDSYPYSAMSIYALHPMYIDLKSLGELKDDSRANYYKNEQIRLNAMDAMDYEAVMSAKVAYCREYFHQEGFVLLKSDEYKCFFERNKSWLMPYSAYCYLRDVYGTADFSCWKEYSIYDPVAIEKLCEAGGDAFPEIAFNYYIQYVLDKQFREVSDYARERGVVLKGDLPIGVNRYSAEVWTEPEYFNLDVQSGAPPDDFSLVGQNWLFPTYKWSVMEQDGFSWWRKRFAKLNDYFDCFRIDHILGFFRIWEIPKEYVQGLCGHFNPALPLSVEEIEHGYGLAFDESRFTTSGISGNHLGELFGEYTEDVKREYMELSADNYYNLKPSCDTQRKIEKLFANDNSTRANALMLGLFTIANEVLFLADPYEQGKYHPRISGSSSFVYKDLSEENQRKFSHLSDDFFYRRHNAFWKEQALKTLSPLVNSTEMLVCGEDLGMIPETVPEVMNQLSLLSLEIERMPKEYGVEFANMAALPYFSVCTTSTHDMSPLRSWWKEDANKTQSYYNSTLHHDGEAPEGCSSQIAEQIIANYLRSDSMLAILPLQDWLSMDDSLKRADVDAERINIPAKTNHYWQYRMHLTIEALLQAEEFNEKVITLTKQCGRL